MTRDVQIWIHKVEKGVATLTITAARTDPTNLRIVWYRDGARVGVTAGWTFEVREPGAYTAELLTPDGASETSKGNIILRPEWFAPTVG